MPLPQTTGRDRFTYGNYVTWSEGERWELLEGQPRAMGPAPGRIHQGVLLSLGSQFRVYLTDKICRAYPVPFDVRLPRGEEADNDVDTVVQPDLSVVCDAKKLDDRGCRGAPDLVVEVTSPSTASYDQIAKKALYERHGVREYWIVHPVDHIVWVYRRTDAGTFGPPSVFGPEDRVPVGIFEDLTVDLKEVFRE
jgi:Uma2 family endonuclease